MNIDPKVRAQIAPTLETARLAFFELWVAMNVAVRAQAVSNGTMPLGHVLTREEQAAILAYVISCVQGAETLDQAAERTKRLRASFGHPDDGAAPQTGKSRLVVD